MSLALWLRAGRAARGLSQGDIARITKIQSRILERLEGGKLEGLPAEVFVRGFIRSYAKCCGLDEAEALTRYGAASEAQALAPVALASPAARAMVEAMADLAPQIARTTPSVQLAQGSLPEIIVPEASASLAVATEPAPTASRKKKHRGAKRSKRDRNRAMATGTPSSPTPVVVARIDVDAPVPTPTVDASPEAAKSDAWKIDEFVASVGAQDEVKVETSSTIDAEVVLVPVDHLDPLVPPADDDEVIATETWQPKMPAPTTTASVPWRRPAYSSSGSTAASSVPSLVIDDSDPDSAEQVLEEREAAKSVTTLAQRRSFLPPILLDREDRGARQGGLTLAVIILLIAATLTLSYLMRRPSSSGDGVTQSAVKTQLIG